MLAARTATPQDQGLPNRGPQLSISKGPSDTARSPRVYDATPYPGVAPHQVRSTLNGVSRTSVRTERRSQGAMSGARAWVQKRLQTLRPRHYPQGSLPRIWWGKAKGRVLQRTTPRTPNLAGSAGNRTSTGFPKVCHPHSKTAARWPGHKTSEFPSGTSFSTLASGHAYWLFSTLRSSGSPLRWMGPFFYSFTSGRRAATSSQDRQGTGEPQNAADDDVSLQAATARDGGQSARTGQTCWRAADRVMRQSALRF